VVFVAPAFAFAVAAVCCFRKEREREEVRQQKQTIYIILKYGRRERERPDLRLEKKGKKVPLLFLHKKGKIKRKGHFFFHESKIAKKCTLFSLQPPPLSPFLFDEAKEFEYRKKQKRYVQIFARTHAPRLRAVLRSFLCLFDLVLLSRFFFLLLINSALFLGIYTRREFVVVFSFISLLERATHAPRVFDARLLKEAREMR